MIGLLPGRVFAKVSRDAPLEFSWVAGDKLWARAAMGEPVSAVWRGALQNGKTAGQEWKTSPARREVRRLVAVPLRVSGGVVGVLVAGLAQSGATLANVERLELRARLAEMALALSARNDAGSATLDYAQFFVDRAGEPLFLLNAKLEITRASETGKKLFSLGPPSATARQSEGRNGGNSCGTAAQLFRPSEWQRLVGWMRDISRNSRAGAPHSLETELRTGKPVRLQAACLPDGSLILFVQPPAEAASTREHPSSMELRSLIEWLEQGVVLFDESDNIRTYNLRFAQLFGLSSDELAGVSHLRELVNIVAPRVSEPSRFAEHWWAASRGGETVHEEVQLARPAPRILERFSRPLLDAAGAKTGRLEIYRDLSMQHLLQEKLRKNERLAAVGERVSGIAHELSNPLTSILGYAQRLLTRPEGQARRDDLHRIFSEAERASTILRQLLGSARGDSSGLQPVSLNLLIQQAVEENRFQLASEKIRVELDLAPDLPAVLGDTGQLQQVLLNLIANSRHALLEQQGPGTISFHTRVSESGRVLLEVSDSGPGIPEALRHRVFDPFFTTKPEGVGTGLGLSIVVGLIRQHGGQIRLQAPRNRGATFLIDFPPTADTQPIFPPAFPSVPVSQPVLANGQRVLVVEDEPTVAQLIADMLSDLGYAPDVQHDARRALISALNRDYALVICDMKMPELDGQHFYRALAEAGSPLISRFIFVTGDILAPATQEFLRQHQLPHVAKPFRVEEFTEKIAWVAGQPKAAPSPSLVLSRQNLIGHG
jgi:PAS domain S-box-containing protein